MRTSLRNALLCAGTALMLAACGGGERAPKPGHDQKIPGVKVGKPYQIQGQWYYPQVQPEYVEEGMASWYGPGFHGKSTANGETYNQFDLTAAHTTLPMPSLVKVTNLDNGKEAVLRVNDRGPFAHSRIIDVSQAAAEKLGMIASGTAQVRVEYLREETETYLAGLGLSVPTPVETYMEAKAQDMPFKGASEKVLASTAPIASVTAQPLPAPAGFAGSDLPPPVLGAADPALASAGQPPEGLALSLPAETVPAPYKEGLYIQVASFSDQANAQSTLAKLGNFNGSVVPVELGGATWYRVRVGPFQEDGAAERHLELVQNLGFPDAKVIRK